ncbi:MAG: four helix bundle protein [Acidobacteria bacterium]|nr:four helix bundle protein [Acidobacteriota bacterium]
MGFGCDNIGTRIGCAARMASRNYTDLIAWQKAMNVAEAVYLATGTLPVEEKFGLCAQMRRAAISIPANIAEGEGRRTPGEFGNQLSVAHGSVRELETHVMLAERLKLMHADTTRDLLMQLGEVGRLVTGLLNSLNR